MPIFKNYCSNCEYIGSYAGKYDLYICKKSKVTSVIFRDGNEIHEYSSIPIFDYETRLKNTPRPGGITDKEHIFIMAINSSFSVLLSNFEENKDGR